ncbi:QRFP-like peptide receptor [Physella acuta]|uniref:QRFP-like peptide receptor n=1 Tax=Physella acuta TaxID=109671 RepID=UPI0027DB21F9|nr:QRFP-like peptide receptor [Physella acuta]
MDNSSVEEFTALMSDKGFQDTVNISFLALAVSDLGSLVTLIWKGITVTLAVAWSDIPFSTDDVSYMTAVVPHAMFVRVSWLITSFITIERCLCVTMPLKVKHVITASRTVAAMALIYVCVFLGMSPFYIGSSLTSVHDLQTNKTRIVRSFSKESVYYTDSIGHNFSVSAQFSSIFIDLLSTLVIVRQMQVKWKWRLESTSSGTSDRLSVREKKLVKMVLAILCVFVACVSPSCASFLCELVYGWKFGLTGPNYNVFITVCSVIITFEAAHSSV